MTYPRTSAISVGVLILLAACSSSTNELNVVKGPLSPIHAEPDPENGGRFVDAEGREVMFSGINVNSFGEYWQWDPDIAPVFPFGEEDVDRFESIGWNAVRLLLTWSRVEPTPGEYDEAYLDEIEAAVRLIESRGGAPSVDARGAGANRVDSLGLRERPVHGIGYHGHRRTRAAALRASGNQGVGLRHDRARELGAREDHWAGGDLVGGRHG